MLVVILILVVILLGTGYPSVVSIAVVLSAAGYATEVARRLTGSRSAVPRLSA